MAITHPSINPACCTTTSLIERNVCTSAGVDSGRRRARRPSWPDHWSVCPGLVIRHDDVMVSQLDQRTSQGR